MSDSSFNQAEWTVGKNLSYEQGGSPLYIPHDGTMEQSSLVDPFMAVCLPYRILNRMQTSER